ncbi:MAG: hypothetical protein JKY92_03025 [Magnetovibrio sp.]|nr:hypothetical protein [Magnetovibrio sp.]
MTQQKPMKPEGKAEELVFKSVKTGAFAIVSKGLDVADDEAWGAAETIRAEFLRHICLHPQIYNIETSGFQIQGARIVGTLNLQFITLEFPIRIQMSRFMDKLFLDQCSVPILNFNGSFFKHGLAADGLKCAGSVSLNNIQSQGEVHLLGADIKDNLSCGGAIFKNEKNDVLSVDRLICGGSVSLEKIQAQGKVRFLGADIKSDLSCDGAFFENEGGDAFNAERSRVGGRLFWRNFKPQSNGRVDFRHAHVGDLIDDLDSWPEMGKLRLDGFTYDNLGQFCAAKGRIAWLDRMIQSSEEFYPQPYEQLIKVLKNAGHEHDAKKIAMAKQDAFCAYLKRSSKADSNKVTWHRRLWLYILKKTTGYGYKPHRALLWSVSFIFVGTFVFEAAYVTQAIVPAKDRVFVDPCSSITNKNVACKDVWETKTTKRFYQPVWMSKGNAYRLPKAYVEFNPIGYSADVFVPFLDLQQETSWMPKKGWWHYYMWFHIIMGWIFTTVTVIGFTGLFKKE